MCADSGRFRALFCIIVCLVLHLSPGSAIADGCPPCDKDVSPPALPGSNLNVCIDGSWDTSPGSGQTVNKVWNATQGAVNSGNSGRGNQQASCAIKTFAEVASKENPDVPASITPTRVDSGYFKLHLPGSTVNHTATMEDLKGIIAHELGHPLGLANTTAGVDPRLGTCVSKSVTSIMGGVVEYPDGKLEFRTKHVQPRDVDAARRKAFSNADCSTIPEDLKKGMEVEDVCSVDPCASIDCPDFVPESCADPLDLV